METRNTLRDLVAWQKAVTLHADLIRLSLQPQVARHPWLAEQLRQSGRSLAGCIAEGHGSRDGMDHGMYYPSAKGDAGQLLTLLVTAVHAGLLEAAVAEPLERRCEELQRILGGMIRARRRDDEPVNGGSRGPWRRPPPSDGGSRGGDPWDNRS
jgi:four helix bundle protein